MTVYEIPQRSQLFSHLAIWNCLCALLAVLEIFSRSHFNKISLSLWFTYLNPFFWSVEVFHIPQPSSQQPTLSSSHQLLDWPFFFFLHHGPFIYPSRLGFLLYLQCKFIHPHVLLIRNARFSISAIISASSSSMSSLITNSWFFLPAYLRHSIAMSLSLCPPGNFFVTPTNLSASASYYSLVDYLLDCCLPTNNHHRVLVLYLLLSFAFSLCLKYTKRVLSLIPKLMQTHSMSAHRIVHSTLGPKQLF
jgi:hypothetical protein